MNVDDLRFRLQEISCKKEKLTQQLVYKADNMLSDILANLADNYPQAPPSGGTPRMRDAILELNRVEEEENDLIFANGIEIGKHIEGRPKIDITLRDDEFKYGEEQRDYTKFIM